MKKCKVCLKGVKYDRRNRTESEGSPEWGPIRGGKVQHWKWDWWTRCGIELSLFGGKA